VLLWERRCTATPLLRNRAIWLNHVFWQPYCHVTIPSGWYMRHGHGREHGSLEGTTYMHVGTVTVIPTCSVQQCCGGDCVQEERSEESDREQNQREVPAKDTSERTYAKNRNQNVGRAALSPMRLSACVRACVTIQWRSYCATFISVGTVYDAKHL
jgi:hypothetical protein